MNKHEVKKLYESGMSMNQIAKHTGIHRSTIRYWVINNFNIKSRCEPKSDIKFSELDENYVYILGQYLGDGYISKHPRTYRMRIFNTQKYTELSNRIELALAHIFTGNKIHQYHTKHNTTEISVYSKHLPILFPQHGEKHKHERKIELTTWQRELIKIHPWDFISGLIHSDGTICNYKNSTYIQFSNKSEDIHDIFTWVCDLVNIKYNNRTIGYMNRTISRKSHDIFLAHVDRKS